MEHSPEYLAAIGHKRLVRLWTNRLRRLIRDVPEGIVALVHPNSIEICREVELRMYEDKNGHRDNPPSIDTVLGSTVFEPNSEST